ncbi:MAG: hypothetical protein ABW321_09295 [Polyangiales bacterium]
MIRLARTRFGAIAATSITLSIAACADDASGTHSPTEDYGDLWLLQTRVYSDENTAGYAIPTRELAGSVR